ncbi:Myo-inositol 2-dehydrogenase [Acidisarcina polymorpha]|uniref:Myo-inositol 2-dehydrogenase n=2 Tax=Acidisarcina polymorpha TaxID=2211140 RepID=A0A2Z5G2P8_9BACT|nr:Myo-inositol 2-dehydrogenase [Acidisarcina polymorpha]
MALNRREFTQLTTAALVSQLLPNLNAQSSTQPLGYAMVGLGRISMGHFMPGLKDAKQSKLTGLVSGHRDKAEKNAAEYGVPTSAIYSYENFDSIRDNKAIDAVYIALPNSMHAEYTIRAAKAGKHVLCEKPMATSVDDCKAMIAACRDNNVKLMIAYRCQLEPTNLRAIQMIRDGMLGSVQAIESANGFNIGPDWRLDKKLAGGGPLMDVGVYSLNACRYLTGEEPQVISAYSSVIDKDGRFSSVEENVGWTMKFPSGIVASCNTTYGGQMNGYFRVHGAKGSIDMDSAFGYQGQHLTAQIGRDNRIDEPSTARDPSQFTRQADYFADCVRNNKEPKMDGQEGLRDIQYMAEIYKMAGVAF